MDAKVLRRLRQEDERRAENRRLIARLKSANPALANHPVLLRWEAESQPIPRPWLKEGTVLEVRRVMGDPAGANEFIQFTKSHGIRFSGDAYGYNRAFATPTPPALALSRIAGEGGAQRRVRVPLSSIQPLGAAPSRLRPCARATESLPMS